MLCCVVWLGFYLISLCVFVLLTRTLVLVSDEEVRLQWRPSWVSRSRGAEQGRSNASCKAKVWQSLKSQSEGCFGREEDTCAREKWANLLNPWGERVRGWVCVAVGGEFQGVGVSVIVGFLFWIFHFWSFFILLFPLVHRKPVVFYYTLGSSQNVWVDHARHCFRCFHAYASRMRRICTFI